MTSIALTNANNCQNQRKGWSTFTPTRLVGIFQRAFEKQVKKKEKRVKSGIPTHRIPFVDEREKKRKKEAQKNKAQSFLFRPVP